MRMLIAALVICVVIVQTFADQPIPAGPERDVIQAANTLQLSDDPARLDAAEQTLKQHADLAAHRLDAMVEFKPELKDRIDRIRQFVGGGEVVDGLRVRLEVDKQAVRPGETINITTTLMNLTDKPMQVEVGYTTTGNYFESGSALAANFTTGATGETAPAQPKWCVGFCGTGATNIIHTLEPMSAVSFTTPATYGPIDSQFGLVPEGQPKPVGLALGKGKYSYIPLNANGTLSLTVQRENRDVRPKPQPKAPQPLDANQPQQLQLINPGFPQPKIDADKPFWHGTMKSNSVELKVFTQQVG